MQPQPQKLLYRDKAAIATYVYGSFGPLLNGKGGIAVVDSSTTLTASVASIGTFSPLKAGDIIELYQQSTQTPIRRKVVSVANPPDSIVVDAVVTLAVPTSAWSFRHASVGAAATDGWARVDDLPGGKTLFLSFTLLAGTFSWVIQSRGQGSDGLTPISILAESVEDATGTRAVAIGEDCFAVRLGVKGTATAPTDQVVTAYIEGRGAR